jgi:hypothetical protein
LAKRLLSAKKKALDLVDSIRENICSCVMLEQLLCEGGIEGASNVLRI